MDRIEAISGNHCVVEVFDNPCNNSKNIHVSSAGIHVQQNISSFELMRTRYPELMMDMYIEKMVAYYEAEFEAKVNSDYDATINKVESFPEHQHLDYVHKSVMLGKMSYAEPGDTPCDVECVTVVYLAQTFYDKGVYRKCFHVDPRSVPANVRIKDNSKQFYGEHNICG